MQFSPILSTSLTYHIYHEYGKADSHQVENNIQSIHPHLSSPISERTHNADKKRRVAQQNYKQHNDAAMRKQKMFHVGQPAYTDH